MIELRRRYSDSKGSDSPSFSRLPEGYQEVEWIRPSAKGAYINTGIIPNDNLDFNVKFSAYTYDGIQMIFGTKNPQYRIYFVSTSNSIESQFPKWGTYYWISDNAGFGVYTFSKEGSLFKLNDLHYNYTISGIESISNIHLFNSSNESDYYSTNYLYYASFKDNGVIVREFIPCYRISDRVAGMYDIVNDVFYTNDGIGEFLYGPDVHYNIPPEYQEVEYLESTGNQYLKIPVSIIDTDKLIFEWAFTQLRTDGFVLGSHFPAKILEIYTHRNSWDGIFFGKLREAPYAEQKYKLFLHNNNVILHREQYLIQEFAASVLYPYDGYIVLNQCYRGNSINNTYYGLARYYNFEIEGKMHLIPCFRKEDNVAGMYDLVSGKFYTNEGTGKFEVGAEVIG